MCVALAAVALAACGTEGSPSGNHRTSGDRHTPGPSPATITLAVGDNGRTVRLSPGQSVAVRLDLAGGMSWHRPVADGAALRLTSSAGGYPHRGPATATFAAVAPGQVTLHSITDAACLHTQPPCGLPQRSWQVTVIVTKS